MKIVKLSRKFVLIVIGTIFSLSIFAQSPEKEKRIYLLDLTGSMEGRGTGVTYDILSTVKNNLSSTLDGIEDKNTEIVIIPFTNKPREAIHSFISEKDYLHRTVGDMKVLPGDTNIADAWEEGIRNLDSTKVNYIFLLTDGLHNTGPSKDVLFERLSNWQNISQGHYYYAFYVMLTPNAKEMEICSIVDSTTNMWLIESMDINASLIKTSINTRKNIYNNPKTSISFSTNNSRIKLEDLNLNLSLQDNDCYEIHNVQKSLLGDSYSFEIVEKRTKLEEPLDTTFNLKISYDQETFPFVFLTPDNVELEIINQGIRKADIMVLGRRNKPVEKISFKRTTYKEPFQGPFRWCRRYLEPTLSIPPYKWCVPDTAYTTTPVLISFNEEAIRSHSKIRFEMKGADDISSTHLLTYNNGKTEYLNAFAKPDTVDISVKILPGIPTTKFEGKIVAYVENIDKINGIESTSKLMNVGTWSLKYKKGIPLFLWLLWILSLALIVAIVYFIIKSLLLFIRNLGASTTKTSNSKNRQKQNQKTRKYLYIRYLSHRYLSARTIHKKSLRLFKLKKALDNLGRKRSEAINSIPEAVAIDVNKLTIIAINRTYWNSQKKKSRYSINLPLQQVTYSTNDGEKSCSMAKAIKKYEKDFNIRIKNSFVFDHGQIDLSQIAIAKVNIKYEDTNCKRYGSNGIQPVAGIKIMKTQPKLVEYYKKLGYKDIWEYMDGKHGENFVRETPLLMHEDANCKTVYLVPSLIHEAISHYGGISVAKIIQESSAWGEKLSAFL